MCYLVEDFLAVLVGCPWKVPWSLKSCQHSVEIVAAAAADWNLMW
jgi:hypothetical protein